MNGATDPRLVRCSMCHCPILTIANYCPWHWRGVRCSNAEEGKEGGVARRTQHVPCTYHYSERIPQAGYKAAVAASC